MTELTTLEFIELNRLEMSRRLQNILNQANTEYKFIKEITPRVLSKFRNVGEKTKIEFIKFKEKIPKQIPKNVFELDGEIKPIEKEKPISVQDFCRSHKLSFEEYDIIQEVLICSRFAYKSQANMAYFKEMIDNYINSQNNCTT